MQAGKQTGDQRLAVDIEQDVYQPITP